MVTEEAAPDRIVKEESQGGNQEHNTLKYSLLGPSLTKAGQDSVDQTKVSFYPDTSRICSNT